MYVPLVWIGYNLLWSNWFCLVFNESKFFFALLSAIMRESNSWPCIRILIAETAMGLLKTWLKICGKWTQFTEQQSRPMYYHQHHRWWWWCWCCYCWWCLEPGLSSANWWSNCKIEAPFLFMWSDNSTSICIGGRVLHRNIPNSIELFETPLPKKKLQKTGAHKNGVWRRISAQYRRQKS